MSHVQKINLEIKNIKALKKAVKKLGLNFNENVSSFNYYSRLEHPCDHTITHKSSNRAIGVCNIAGTKKFELKWDPDYLGEAQKIVGSKAEKLKQEYAVQVAIQEAENQGMLVTRYTQKDGSVRLEAVYA